MSVPALTAGGVEEIRTGSIFGKEKGSPLPAKMSFCSPLSLPPNERSLSLPLIVGRTGGIQWERIFDHPQQQVKSEQRENTCHCPTGVRDFGSLSITAADLGGGGIDLLRHRVEKLAFLLDKEVTQVERRVKFV